MEERLVYGPGDVLGEPARLTDEYRLFLWRVYEVYPRGHRLAGRRRFKRVVLSRRKGVAKTEIQAWVAIAELDPTAPVRCDGWRVERGEWIPVGRPVRDPYIPLVAYTEEQTEDLAYAAVYEILTRGPLAEEYDVGLERIVHKREPGKLQALASAPSARDGARTTFQGFDETHRFVSPRLRDAHATMLRNIPKRKASDAWSLETTTMYAPGEDSVAEASHLYALDVMAGKVADPRLLFDHRQASERHDLSTRKGLLAAIQEASGDAWAFTDADAVAAQFDEPNADINALRRFWLNQRAQRTRRWIASDVWDGLADEEREVDEEQEIILTFDGSYSRDSTALIGTTVEEKPHTFVVRIWERPLSSDGKWRTPRNEVCDAVDEAMERYNVIEFAPDPPGWGREIEDWEGTYGDVVVRFETNQPRRMGPACDDFEQAVRDAELSQDGDSTLARHIANCVPVYRRGYTLIDTAQRSGPQRSGDDEIDAAVGAVVGHHRARWHFANGQDDVVAFVVNVDGSEDSGDE